jgi:hypothetical protein
VWGSGCIDPRVLDLGKWAASRPGRLTAGERAVVVDGVRELGIPPQKLSKNMIEEVRNIPNINTKNKNYSQL